MQSDGPDEELTPVGQLNPEEDAYVHVDLIGQTPEAGSPGHRLVGLMIQEGEADASTSLTPDEARAIAAWLIQGAQLASEPADIVPDTPERIVQAAAADAYAMTASELGAFLADVGNEVPDHAVGIRARTSHLGDIASITAQIPPAPGTAARELPGDALRDVAALLEAIEQEDLSANFTLFTETRSSSHWQMASLLAGECLKLAHKVYGPKVPAGRPRHRRRRLGKRLMATTARRAVRAASPLARRAQRRTAPGPACPCS
jgi:hypothetical protein